MISLYLIGCIFSFLVWIFYFHIPDNRIMLKILTWIVVLFSSWGGFLTLLISLKTLKN